MPGWLGTNIFCLAVLFHIFFSIEKAKMHMPNEVKAYHDITLYFIFSFILDSLSRLYAYEGFDVIFPLIKAATYLKYITLPLMIPLFYKFFLEQLRGEIPKYLKVVLKCLWVLQVAVTFIVLSSFYTKWAFYFDADGVYHRGVFFGFPAVIMMIMGLLVELIVIINRDRLPKKKFRLLLLSFMLPVAGGIIQALVYGLALCYMGGAFSLLIIYFDITSRVSNRDYLTGLNNRKTFDYYLSDFINDESKQPFGVAVIDIDYFKEINDKLGHAVGDRALANLGVILMNSVRGDDIVCRMGGDEFAILFRNCRKDTLEKIIRRLNQNVHNFNKTANEPYVLHISIGSGVYDSMSSDRATDFLSEIDGLMYKDKNSRKEHISRENVTRNNDDDEALNSDA